MITATTDNEYPTPRSSGVSRVPSLPSKPQKKQNPHLLAQMGVSEFNLDDDLLSHGEAPHYHRRCIVSLLSSGWDQVVPMLYGRQEIRVPNRQMTCRQIRYVMSVSCKSSDTVIFTTPQSGCPSLRKRRKLLGCYMVKPHGQLVLVSSTPHSAYTPNLSTS